MFFLFEPLIASTGFTPVCHIHLVVTRQKVFNKKKVLTVYNS